MAMYLAVHSIRCSNTVGAAGEGFVAVVALDRLDGRVGGDDPLQGDWGHRSGSQAGGNNHGDDNITDAGDDDVIVGVIRMILDVIISVLPTLRLQG